MSIPSHLMPTSDGLSAWATQPLPSHSHLLLLFQQSLEPTSFLISMKAVDSAPPITSFPVPAGRKALASDLACRTPGLDLEEADATALGGPVLPSVPHWEASSLGLLSCQLADLQPRTDVPWPALSGPVLPCPALLWLLQAPLLPWTFPVTSNDRHPLPLFCTLDLGI